VRPFRKIHHLSRPEQPVDKAVDLLPPHTSDMFEPLSGLRDIKPRQAKGMLAVLMGRESVPEPHHQGPDEFVRGVQVRKLGQFATPESIDLVQGRRTQEWGRDVAQKAGANSMERGRAAIVVQKTPDFRVARPGGGLPLFPHLVSSTWPLARPCTSFPVWFLKGKYGRRA
jgi:hypothetical protein